MEFRDKYENAKSVLKVQCLNHLDIKNDIAFYRSKCRDSMLVMVVSAITCIVTLELNTDFAMYILIFFVIGACSLWFSLKELKRLNTELKTSEETLYKTYRVVSVETESVGFSLYNNTQTVNVNFEHLSSWTIDEVMALERELSPGEPIPKSKKYLFMKNDSKDA